MYLTIELAPNDINKITSFIGKLWLDYSFVMEVEITEFCLFQITFQSINQVILLHRISNTAFFMDDFMHSGKPTMPQLFQDMVTSNGMFRYIVICTKIFANGVILLFFHHKSRPKLVNIPRCLSHTLLYG